MALSLMYLYVIFGTILKFDKNASIMDIHLNQTVSKENEKSETSVEYQEAEVKGEEKTDLSGQITYMIRKLNQSCNGRQQFQQYQQIEQFKVTSS
jgi:hypothetical protein